MILRFTLILMLFVSNVVWAQGNPLPSTDALANLTVNQSDVSVSRLLSQLFGGLIPEGYSSGGGLNPLSEAISIFNAIILVFGAVLLAYTLVSGTMQTAHDGEMLGKRWSSMWLPLRTCIGISALAPLPSGYCIIQYIVMWMVLQGVGAANWMWTTFASSSQPLAQMAMSHDYKNTNSMAANTLRQAVCVVAVNGEFAKAKAQAEADGRRYEGLESIGMYSFDAGRGYSNIALRRPETGSGGSSALKFEKEGLEKGCGSYTFPASTPITDAGSQTAKMFGGVDKVNQFSASVQASQVSAFGTLQNEMIEVAKGIYENNLDGATGLNEDQAAVRYSKAVDQYNKTVNATVQSGISSISGNSEVAQNATRDGWALAGAYYLKFINIQQGIADVLAKTPIVEPPKDSNALNPSMKQQIGPLLEQVEFILGKTSYTDGLGIVKQVAEDKSKPASGTFEKLVAKAYAQSELSTFSPTFFNPNRNAILEISSFGHSLMSGSISMLGGLSLAASVLPNSSVTVGAIFLLPLFGALFGAAAVMAYVIPFTPFIIWFGVVLGWLVMVVEAIVAAPMWILSHLYPDGDGIVGRAGQGYSLVFALFLRPALAVFGLIASMSILNPVMNLLSDVFLPSATLAVGAGNTFLGMNGPITKAAIYTLFAAFTLGLVNKIFNLIHVIPDQIFKWMGGPSGDLGSYGGDMVRSSTGAASAVGGVVGGMAGKGLEAAQNVRRLGEEKKQTEQMRDTKARNMLSQQNEQQSQMGATEKAYASAGLSEGGGVAKAELATNRDNADKFLEAEKQVRGSPAYQKMEKEGDQDGMYAMVHHKQLSNVQAAENKAAAKEGRSASNYGDVGAFNPRDKEQPKMVQQGLENWKDDSLNKNYQDWKGQPSAPTDAADTYQAAKNKFVDASRKQAANTSDTDKVE